MQPFVIPVKGLKAGKNAFEWHFDGEFFGTFENQDIRSADLTAVVSVDVDGSGICVDCAVDGTVTVLCDRCLEDLVIPVHTSFQSDDYDCMENLDLSQDVYDYVCISLPMLKVHPDGECNGDTVKYLSK